jgi:Uma2 family endonuclease
MDLSRIRITNAEYIALPDDGKRYELHEGALVEMPSATVIHALIVALLVEALRSHIQGQKLGYVMPDNLDFILNEGLILKPDVSFVAAARVQGGLPDYFHFAPDLAVEVLSPSNSASEISYKIQTFLRYGSRLIWIIDPTQKTVTVHEPGTEGIILWRVLTQNDTLTGGDVLPEFRLPVRTIFEEMEGL